MARCTTHVATGSPAVGSPEVRELGLWHDWFVDEPFSVDIWSDVVCPFCYLGARQLAGALKEFDHHDEVVVRHRAFELDPHASIDADLALPELLVQKYAMPLERAHALNQRLETDALALGMTWSLQRARPTNTLDAHRLIALAATQNLDALMSERLFRAYFSEGQLVSDHDTLSALGAEVGVEGVDALWRNDAFTDDVRSDEVAAYELGITGVPSLLVDNKFMVVGAQGAPRILDVLQRAWARR
jgi:predicted DsbA family dithiol-disulfide isomerase